MHYTVVFEILICLYPSTMDELWEWCLKKEGGAMNQTEPNTYGIHDNPVSGSHPPGTVETQMPATQLP